MWKNGVIGKYRWEAKIYKTGSHFGIGGGRISKLSIRRGKKCVFNYDRGFDFVTCSIGVLFKVLDNISKEELK